MLILALDTTTRVGSCALARDGRVLREEASDPSLPPASRLPGELVALLERAGMALPDVDAFAVATGPGSFTGMRVGIATMQGLAFARAKPLFGVSAFEALAVIGATKDPASGGAPRRVATWIDAWRGEVYAGLFEDGRQLDPHTVAPPRTLLPRLAGKPTVFIGDAVAVYHDLIHAALGRDAWFADPAAPLLAGVIARLATDAARAGSQPPPHAVRPLYVRRPDAELARAARSATTPTPKGPLSR